MFPRYLTPTVVAALKRSPVVLLNGARQVGKSTLARGLVGDGILTSYRTLDDLATLDAARSDPEGFLGASEAPIVIDEVQLEPRLFRAVKASVDRDRRPGRFLLTGSADLMVLPDASDALVGRMEVCTLWPLTRAEIEMAPGRFVDAVFAGPRRWIEGGTLSREALAQAVCEGGFPEPIQRPPTDREAWFRSYVETVVRRDIRERADIEHLAAMPKLLALMASRTMTLVSLSEVARAAELPASTVRRYVHLLEAAMLVRLVPAFAGDLAKRVVKSPRVALVDTGLAAALSRVDADRLVDDPVQMGRLAETIAVNEIQSQIGWNDTPARVMHARTSAGREVDIVLETPDGRIVGVEVKAGRTITSGDFAGLRALKAATGKRFVQGVALHTGHGSTPFANDLWSVPFDALWMASP